MANVLATFNQQHWAKEMQATYIKENVARGFVSETLASQLVDGTRINRPYRSGLKATTYTKGTDISVYNDLTGVNEYLDIDTTPLVAFYVDRFIQSTINFVNCWKLLQGILAKTEYLKWYIRTMLKNNMIGTISSQA